MNIFKILALTFLISLGISACSSPPKYVTLDKSSEYTSVGLDYHDLLDAANKSIDSLFKSRYVSKISKPKVVAISDILNDTMQNIDTEQVTRKVIREMRNNGKFILTLAISGSGTTKDKLIYNTRKVRDDDEFNQYSVPEKGELLAPELSLSGKIVQKNTMISGGDQRIDYFFLLTLVDIKSGLVLWDDEVNIIKVASGRNVAW